MNAVVAAWGAAFEAAGISGSLKGDQAGTGSAQPTEHRCATCGLPLERGTGRVPKKRHESCVSLHRYLNASEAALVETLARGVTPESAREIRRRLIAMANRLPVAWGRPRQANGRFSKP